MLWCLEWLSSCDIDSGGFHASSAGNGGIGNGGLGSVCGGVDVG